MGTEVIIPKAFVGRTSTDEQGRIIFPVRIYGGLGDHLFALPAMSEYAKRLGYPCFDVLACQYFDLFENLPYVNVMHRITQQDLWPPPLGHSSYSGVVCLNWFPPFDSGDAPTRNAFHLLEINDTPFCDRCLSLPINGSDRNLAYEFLENMGWRGERVIGVQESGAMKAKHYSHMPNLLIEMKKRGWFVYWTRGNGWGPGEVLYFASHGPNGVAIQITSHIRQLAALQSVSYAYLGFESGASYLSIAAGCPTVILAGPLDNWEYMRSLEGNRYFHQIRMNWVHRCARQFGITCRAGYGVEAFGGSAYCPIRGMWFGDPTPDKSGCDCMDIVSIDEICAAVEMIGNKKVLEALDARLPA